MFNYITLMGEISSKKKMSKLVSVFCKQIYYNCEAIIAHPCYTYVFVALYLLYSKPIYGS